METKTIVVTQKDIRLDELVFLEYGSLDLLEEILERNISTIKQQVHLPLGLRVEFPVYETQTVKEVEASRLW